MTKKLDTADLDKIQEFQSRYAEITQTITARSIDKHVLETQLEQVTAELTAAFSRFDTIQTQERELIQSFQDKYGIGEIDIESGTFTPTE